MADSVASSTQDVFALFGLLTPIQRGIVQSMNRWWSNQTPAVADIVHAWRTGQLGALDAKKAIEASACYGPHDMYQEIPVADRNAIAGRERDEWYQQGGWHEAWKGVWNAQAVGPSVAEALSMWMRGRHNDDATKVQLSRNGVWRTQDQFDLKWLATNRIPGPDSLVAFAVKDVWDQRVVDRFQYDAEFPAEFRHWMEQQGAAGAAQIPGPQNQNPPSLSWAQLFWRAHWRNLSPTQAYEMFQRLRPNRVGRLAASLPGLRPFTWDDLQTTLKVNDFPAVFRPQLAAIAYGLPRLVDIDRFFLGSLIDRREALEMHLDRGYSPPDAELRVKWLEQRKLTQPQGAIARSLPKHIVELYTLGRLTRSQAADRLLSAITTGAFENALNAPAIPFEREAWVTAMREVDTRLGEADLRMEISRTKKLLAALRRQFLHGVIDETKLRSELAVMGYAAEWSLSFVAGLRAELASGRMMLSTSRIARLVRESLISITYAEKYLRNLGWKEPELPILLAQMRRQQDAEIAKEEARQATDRRRAEEASMREANLLRKARQQTIARLNRQASPARLQRYFVRNIITEAELDKELRRRGFDDEYRQRFIEDSRIARDSYRGGRRQRAAADRAGEAGAGGTFGGNGRP